MLSGSCKPVELRVPWNCLDATDATHATDATNATGSMLESKLSELILDCFFFVYKQFGYGFLEAVYSNALATELEYRGVKVRREVAFELYHRGKRVGVYRSDILVADRVVIEVKSTKQLVEADERQLINCLKATPIEVGFLLHFGPKPKFIRRVLTQRDKHSGLATD